MLAYVFWHWASPGVAPSAYEASLVAFHETLARHAPAGFRRSFVFTVQDVPWADTPGPVYEDWYLVEDFTALGRLNEGAVSGVRREPHDAVAQRADGGVGSVFRLRAGAPVVTRVQFALRFSKPPGMPYDAFYGGIPGTALEAGGGLWERQMVLGPAPEGCLLAPEVVDIPHALDPMALAVALCWDSAS